MHFSESGRKSRMKKNIVYRYRWTMHVSETIVASENIIWNILFFFLISIFPILMKKRNTQNLPYPPLPHRVRSVPWGEEKDE